MCAVGGRKHDCPYYYQHSGRAATLLESLRTQGYSAEIIAPCEIEIQCAPGSSVGESVPVIPLPVEQFVFSDYQSSMADPEQLPVREFVLMPLLRTIGVHLGNLSAVIQNAGHAAAFAFRDLLRRMARRRREAREWQDKQLNLSRPPAAYWSAFREKLLRLQTEMLGVLIASFIFTLRIVYGRHFSPPQTAGASQKAASGNAELAATASPQPETPSTKPVVRQHQARLHARVVTASTAPPIMARKRITPRRRSYLAADYVAEDEVIVHYYATPKKNQVLAKGVNRYSDLE